MVIVAAVAGAACGGDSAATPSTPVVSVLATDYQTLAPTPSTNAPVTTSASAPGAVTLTDTDYLLAEGDLPATIAKAWNIPLQALLDANGWTLTGQYVTNFPPVGTTIKIPAGATVPGLPTGATTATGSETTTATSAPPTVTTTVVTSACGTYAITADDTSRIGVATKFNTTVEKLDAANVNTKGYSGFYPGLVIQLPC